MPKHSGLTLQNDNTELMNLLGRHPHTYGQSLEPLVQLRLDIHNDLLPTGAELLHHVVGRVP